MSVRLKMFAAAMGLQSCQSYGINWVAATIIDVLSLREAKSSPIHCAKNVCFSTLDELFVQGNFYFVLDKNDFVWSEG